MLAAPAAAQRVTDVVGRGIVAVPGRSGGNFVSWRMLGEEYYDTQYNLYRDGTKIAGPLKVTNYNDASGSSSSSYQVQPVVKGVEQEKSEPVSAWGKQYFVVNVPDAVDRDGKTVTDDYELNDISLADVDGDGKAEFLTKRVCSKAADKTQSKEFHHYEVYNAEGKRLWWIDMGPNMLAGADEQWDMVGYDWDRDGKAEALLRGADNMIIHTASGKTIKIGDMTYDDRKVNGTEYTKGGAEYLLYLNGETGEPYGWDGSSDSFTPMAYPLPRFEQGESDYAIVWGSNDTGHRACKHYFGAPYLDGAHASIFLGRGCYTRHKMCALDVDPATHKLTQRWRWNCYDSKSPWFGNGFHNFAIADVDMDGRDEIVFGSMIIDDTGHGLATTGLGHGDAQHCGDLDPYRWGLEQFSCLEGSGGNVYWNATTGDIYYRKSGAGDDGRSLGGNFTDDIPGGQGRSVSSGIVGFSSDKIVDNDGDSKMAWGDLNGRIYWDGDLLDEIFNSPGVGRVVKITKWGNGRIFTSPTGTLNNSSKNNPCAQGDILGDWREEFIVDGGKKELHIYTTNYPTDYAFPTLWSDHQYRNAMVWQCVGYNQPPHPSFFLGAAEGITQTPPPLMVRGRKTVANGGTISTTDDHLLIDEQNDMTVNVADGASPYIVTDNAPSWVQGTGDKQATASTPKQPAPNYIYYTHTLTGGAFTGATRVVKQGEGTLVLPNVTETYTGNTDVWNGKLSFDGTMQKSPVWLNRHTTLLSDGGKFLGGLRADYNATIYPGGKGKAGSITASTLKLGFGSRIVLDKDDKVNADSLVIETKSWENGPKYKAPVLEFTYNPEPGSYDLGAVAKVKGDVNDLVIEGLSGSRFALETKDGHLYLNVEAYRESTTVTWNGSDTEQYWDLGVTENFLDPKGLATYAAQGDDIVFDDNAKLTTVTIKGAVTPKSVTFNNDTKDYTLTGDSILGGAPLVKNGKGKLYINNVNHTGATTINGGTVEVSQLANNTGVAYGSLGDVSRQVTLNDGVTLSVSSQISTDQPFNVSGNVTVNTPSSQYLVFNKGLKGRGANVIKTGSGSVTLGPSNTFSRLTVNQGTVNCVASGNTDQLPDTVEFGGGTLWGVTSDNNYIQNNANFVVPAGKTGTFYGSYRGNYHGKLLGTGTFNVYTGGVRCYWEGDWSAFTGTVKVGKLNRQAKPAYDPQFDFNNTYGLPNATLSIAADVNVSNDGKDFPVGNVIGDGTLVGSGRWILGDNDQNFNFGGNSKATLVKRGTGIMRIVALGKLDCPLYVTDGYLAWTDSKLATRLLGTKTLTVNGSGKVVANGIVQSLTMSGNAKLTPSTSVYTVDNPTARGTFATTTLFTASGNATVIFNIVRNGSNSKLEVGTDLRLSRIKINLGSAYTPKNGDEFTLWTCKNMRTAPSSIELPELPSGLYWDTTALTDGSTTGVLKVTNVSTGISAVKTGGDNAAKTIYTVDGKWVYDMHQPGVYIVNEKKVVVK